MYVTLDHIARICVMYVKIFYFVTCTKKMCHNTHTFVKKYIKILTIILTLIEYILFG